MRRKEEAGFSLVELMIGLAVSSVMVYVIFVAMRVAGNAMDTSNLKMTIQTSAREGMYRMLQEIRETSASRISVGSGNASLTFTVPNSSSPVTSGYAINWGDQVQYALGTGSNSTKLIRTNLSTNGTKVMANDVTGITFSLSGSEVTVTMSVQRTLANGRTVPATALQMRGQAKIRNAG